MFLVSFVYLILRLNWIFWIISVLPCIPILWRLGTYALSCFIEYVYLLCFVVFLFLNTRCFFRILLDLFVVDLLSVSIMRFEVIMVLFSVLFNTYLHIHCYLLDNGMLDSLSGVYGNSICFECEIWDMFGLAFVSLKHNIYHIFLDYGFKGYPLRKDFSLSGLLHLRYSFLLNIINSFRGYYANVVFRNSISSWCCGC